ncbi:transglutaminase-like domain-containing protein [Nitrosopumilus sp.]|nr:transglutaminase-like domain-containing protein [Nitrosopumilus sp.]MDB4849913.1 transglutaminase-like domain-containing protein [Nitrosopumilus sp.]MDC0329714.1 transglutaminase-like domain-containing protein [Nitrosopumilus sp.]MDC0885993.1 transglutaminase-like domain-containing protein [Nitrosopumilus sp.]
MSEKFDPLVAEWISFVKNPNFNLIEKCLKFSQLIEYPDLQVEEYIKKINRVGMSLKESISDVKNPTYLISMLNEHLFENLGYSGDDDDYYNPKNNFLNEVVDKKTGLPITISILYVEIAKFVGLDLKIVGFPGHILVKYNEEMILDPFYDGRLLDIDDLQEILDANFGGELEFKPEFLDEVKSEQILLRMVRNLKNSYIQSFVYDKALRCVNMAIAIEPENPEDIRDKGILEQRLLNSENALKYLNKYLEINPNAEDVDFILELIRSIKIKD